MPRYELMYEVRHRTMMSITQGAKERSFVHATTERYSVGFDADSDEQAARAAEAIWQQKAGKRHPEGGTAENPKLVRPIKFNTKIEQPAVKTAA